ncbi:MAG: hypothetical protein PHT12_00065 [Patescibacteria group bacterium]|nr:hypothetical protein [Patescibacteria group bacterium]
MMLVLDYRNRVARFGVVARCSSSPIKWMKASPPVGSFRPLARAFEAFGLARRHPKNIVVCLPDRAAGAEHVSWSTVRLAVTTANALAFAWRVPVAEVRLGGAKHDAALTKSACRAVSRARLGQWARPFYDGEPNITKSNKPLI